MSLDNCYKKNLEDSTLFTGWYYISDINNGFVRQLDKKDEFYIIDPFPIVTAEDMTKLTIEKNRWGNTKLAIQFGAEGTELWRIATGKAIGKKLAFIVNDKLVYAPYVNSEIPNGNSVLERVDYTKEEIEKVKQRIEDDKTEILKVPCK